MKNMKDLNYYKGLNYNAIFKKEGERYYLFIAELSLIVEGASLAEAYEKLAREKEAYFDMAAKMGILDTVREPVVVAFRNKFFLDLMSFFARTFIVVFLCLTALIMSLPFVQVFLVKGLTQAPLKEFSSKFYNKLENMPDAEKEQARLKLRKVLQNIKPFVDEVREIYKDEDAKAKVRP